MIVDIASGANLAAAAAVAVCAGALNSVAGGGSLILFPTLVGLGLPTVAANVTNSVAQWPPGAWWGSGDRSPGSADG